MSGGQLKIVVGVVAVFAIALGVVAATSSDDPGGAESAGQESAGLARLADAPGRGGGGNVGQTAGIVGGSPVKSNDNRRNSVALSATGEGFNPSFSSRAKIKLSIAFLGHPSGTWDLAVRGSPDPAPSRP